MKTSDKDKYDAVLYWENIATTRRYAKHTSEIEKRVILEANNLAPKQSKVLEIGCEGGRWSKLLADTGCQIICTDTNQDALNVCKSRIPAATCILASPTGILLPCDTESIGMTLCIEVPQVIQAHWFIDEAFRVLHVGGLLVGVFFNRSSWRGLAHYALAPLRGGSIYTYCLSYPQWRRKLSKRGFSLLEPVMNFMVK